MLLLFFLVIVVVIFVLKLYLVLTTGINKCSKHLVGKVVIVTGGNAGIGYETAKDLADRGARVIIGCRNKIRGTAAKEKIVAATGNKDIHYLNLDLASLTSVRKFADEIIKTEKRLDILINNVGVIEHEFIRSEDHLLVGMQVNHFGPFLLTNLLLPLLKSSAPSRIINVSSSAYRAGTIDFNNLNMQNETKETFNFVKLYSNTKLANLLMTVELKRILDGTGVTANALHPGFVYTSILEEVDKFWVRYVYAPLSLFFFKNAWEGAQTTIYLAVSPEVEDVSGRYFSDCKEEKLKAFATDPAVAKKLWEISELIVRLNDHDININCHLYPRDLELEKTSSIVA